MTPTNQDDLRAIHTPVMLAECIQYLSPALAGDGGLYVDATCGIGGHIEGILSACPQARAIGIDRDTHALELAARRLGPAASRVTFVHADYDRIGDIIAEHAEPASAILFDLGVSSLQIDDTSRGFSYMRDAPLDMRMDQDSGPSAADVVNEYSEAELTRIVRTYGEEPFAQRIARAIVRERTSRPFSRTHELAEVAARAVPQAVQARRGHPAKRLFQAIRIEVNHELAILETAIPAAISALRPGGRIVVMSYHSLEDRIVKHAFAQAARDSSPEGLPVPLPGHEPVLRLLTRGALRAGADEIARNPRSASVRFRAAEREPSRGNS